VTKAGDVTESEEALFQTVQPSQSSSAESPSTSSSVGKSAGRGGLAVATAKLYFLFIGLLQQILLPRVLGTAGYGGLSTVLSVSAVVYNPIVTTSIQGVSRTVAQSDDNERPAAIRRVLSIHAKLALPIALLFFLLSSTIVKAVHAPHLVVPLRLMSLVLLFYGLYAPLIGVFNGRREFVWQAGCDIVYATIRTILMVGGAYVFTVTFDKGVFGAALGFVIASAIIALIALPFAGIGVASHSGPRMKDYLVFVGPVFVGQVLFNLLQQADLTVLRYFAASAAIAQHLGPEQADPLVGSYRATQLFCFLPYQLLLSITFVLFPLLAKAHRDGNSADVKTFVMTGIRLAVIIAGLLVSVISGLSGPLLRLVFPKDVAVHATAAMQLLSLGFGAFAIFGILTTVLTSLQQERRSAAITGLAFLLVAVLGCLLLRGQAFGAGQLLRTAIATSIGLLAATAVAAYYVHKTAGGVVRLVTLLRVVFCVAITVALGRLWTPSGKLMTIVAAMVLAAFHVGLLVASRELTSRDLGQVLSVFRRKPKRA
jgi:stage V sporulation protein B